LALANVVLPWGWGLHTGWGPFVMGALLAAAVSGCYWLTEKHEEQLAAQGGRPLQLSNWTIKWFALGMLLAVTLIVYYVIKTT